MFINGGKTKNRCRSSNRLQIQSRNAAYGGADSILSKQNNKQIRDLQAGNTFGGRNPMCRGFSDGVVLPSEFDGKSIVFLRRSWIQKHIGRNFDQIKTVKHLHLQLKPTELQAINKRRYLMWELEEEEDYLLISKISSRFPNLKPWIGMCDFVFDLTNLCVVLFVQFWKEEPPCAFCLSFSLQFTPSIINICSFFGLKFKLFNIVVT